VLEVLEVARNRLDPAQLAGAAIDAPSPGNSAHGHALDIKGWVIGARARAQAVEIVGPEGIIRSVPVRMPRPDVGARFSQLQGMEACGFQTGVGLLGLGDRFKLGVRALFEDGTQAAIATIVGTRTPLSFAREPGLRPIVVTSLGRTGTTWLMRLLLEHPQIVVHPAHPHEVHAAAYWAHLFKVLAEPADHLNSAHPDAFRTTMSQAGHHPFFGPPVTAEPAMQAWFSHEYPRQLAEFSVQSTDSFYVRLAESQGKTGAQYFAEKFQPDRIPWLMWELYPQAREVVLVRDFRDVVCSILAFNRKRGFADFGRESVATDEEFVGLFSSHCRRLLEAYRSRADRVHLLRYEDLILHPDDSLRSLLGYLGLPFARGVVAGMLERTSAVGGPLAAHRTSGDSRGSIGRWRRDMDPSMQRACDESLSQVLMDFGYGDHGPTEMAYA
jgi:hypothetical protein